MIFSKYEGGCCPSESNLTTASAPFDKANLKPFNVDAPTPLSFMMNYYYIWIFFISLQLLEGMHHLQLLLKFCIDYLFFLKLLGLN